MIISRTPLRISFAGGGSDLPSFYSKSPGAVVSTTINKYIYITVNRKFDNLIRASYSVTEFAKEPKKLQHELVRECLLMQNINAGIEITSIADIPSTGTGLGSSSSYTVGLLNTLHAYKGEYASAEQLAQEASVIEMEKCKKPIGKQDQYAAAHGGFNFIQFKTNNQVLLNPIICSKQTVNKLEQNLLLLFTGITRKSDIILNKQNYNTKSLKYSRYLQQMVELAVDMKNALQKNRLNTFAEILHANWNLKKKMASNISNSTIDKWYHIARNNGALGGKILGAGGGGFLLLYAPKRYHKKIIKALPKLKYTPFSFDQEGSKIIYFADK